MIFGELGPVRTSVPGLSVTLEIRWNSMKRHKLARPIKEAFRCVRCNYTADADYVGALNILAKTAGYYRELMVPAS
jgi:hypothetical protein